jgi:toxin FitB
VIILDTNVLSALMDPRADAHVVAWLDAQPWDSVWTTAVTVFEVRFGLEILPAGARRRRLAADFDRLLAQDLEQRVLDFDAAAAAESASLAAQRSARGRPVDFRDTQIAGIVRARRATLATRNVKHFEDAGIVIVDPWRKNS